MGEGKLHIIYTDGSSGGGSSHGNMGDIGSWAFVELDTAYWMTSMADKVNPFENIPQDGVRVQRKSGYVYGTTNNRMEMQAIINAVRSLPIGSRVRVHSDSGYCVDGYNHPSYLKKWIYNGWRTSKKQPVENRDLWEQFLQIGNDYDIQLTLIKGHKKDSNKIHSYWNEMCDHMCTDMRLIAVGRYEDRDVQIPMICPDGCRFMGQIMDQDGMCHRCPVMLCKNDNPVIPFNEFNNEWLIEWDKFFRGEIKKPILEG